MTEDNDTEYILTETTLEVVAAAKLVALNTRMELINHFSTLACAANNALYWLGQAIEKYEAEHGKIPWEDYRKK